MKKNPILIGVKVTDGKLVNGMTICTSSACPTAQMDFSTTDISYCEGNEQPIQLTVISPLDPNEYTGEWSGQGISPSGLYDGAGI